MTPVLHTIYRARPLADGNKLPEQVQPPHQHEQNCGVQGLYNIIIKTSNSDTKTCYFKSNTILMGYAVAFV